MSCIAWPLCQDLGSSEKFFTAELTPQHAHILRLAAREASCDVGVACKQAMMPGQHACTCKAAFKARMHSA